MMDKQGCAGLWIMQVVQLLLTSWRCVWKIKAVESARRMRWIDKFWACHVCQWGIGNYNLRAPDLPKALWVLQDGETTPARSDYLLTELSMLLLRTISTPNPLTCLAPPDFQLSNSQLSPNMKKALAWILLALHDDILSNVDDFLDGKKSIKWAKISLTFLLEICFRWNSIAFERNNCDTSEFNIFMSVSGLSNRHSHWPHQYIGQEVLAYYLITDSSLTLIKLADIQNETAAHKCFI